MKIIKIIKQNLLGLIVGIIISGTLVYAATVIQASQVTYNNQPLNTVLDDLYTQARTRIVTCMKLSGKSEAVGAKYACNPGDGVIRNFYLLKVDGNNVKLIMEQNLSDTVGSPRISQTAALAYFTTGSGASTASAWTNVISVALPDVQDIADAGGITGWDVTTATQSDWSYFGTNGNTDSDKGNRTPYAWLYNYTIDCVSNGACTNNGSSAYGYWTKNLVQNNSSRAWLVDKRGGLGHDSISGDTLNGVRPVITILKSGLSG